VGETGLLVGCVGLNEGRPGRAATNSAALLHKGRMTAARTKTLLPTYDVFDEDRYFEPASGNLPVEFKGHKLGLTICEDAWNDEEFWRDRRYHQDPVAQLMEEGADYLINISASPWHLGKGRMRRDMLASLAAKCARPILYCNAVGGNDELVFDGRSLAYNGKGEVLASGASFAEDFVVVDLEDAPAIDIKETTDEELLQDALALGIRDYLGKCGFKAAVIGLSGGIDSAVSASLAVAALGAENVRGVAMPSQYSSPGSVDDARALAENLGIQFDVIPIRTAFDTLKEELAPTFEGRPEDVTEENMQARLRGLMLMSISNKFGSLVLTTGNKSELAVGYCTLYGDMCGGLAVISDVPKTMVYRLANWINRERELIPQATIKKPPSAELRPDQKDEDSLPHYDILDGILESYVVRGNSVPEIIGDGYDEGTVQRIVRLVDHNEYKRRQAAPGLKVTSKAFGVGRRIPVAQRYRDLG
jgi:NAD+ synthase/NAD+ synthase (glutamine-hydrolysing)